MTTLAAVLPFEPREAIDISDPEADIGFFTMSTSSAEQVTIQIRTVLDRAWEYIAMAYKGQAHLALGYPGWDDYVDARFGDLRITVPREHRTQVVTSLAGARMSIRAIAKLLGVGVGTVHRELARVNASAEGVETPEGGLPPVLGRDGKTYSRTSRVATAVCCTCGENHPSGTVDCPWDLYAQGVDPHPHGANRSNHVIDADKVSAPNGGPIRQLSASGHEGTDITPERTVQASSNPEVADADLRELLTQIELIVANLRTVSQGSIASTSVAPSRAAGKTDAVAERSECGRWASLVEALLHLTEQLQLAGHFTG